MNVTFTGRVPCLLCGYLFTCYRFSTVRVNMRSLKETAPPIVWGGGMCPECGTGNYRSHPVRWRADPADAAAIEAARTRLRQKNAAKKAGRRKEVTAWAGGVAHAGAGTPGTPTGITGRAPTAPTAAAAGGAPG